MSPCVSLAVFLMSQRESDKHIQVTITQKNHILTDQLPLMIILDSFSHCCNSVFNSVDMKQKRLFLFNRPPTYLCYCFLGDILVPPMPMNNPFVKGRMWCMPKVRVLGNNFPRNPDGTGIQGKDRNNNLAVIKYNC